MRISRDIVNPSAMCLHGKATVVIQRSKTDSFISEKLTHGYYPVDTDSIYCITQIPKTIQQILIFINKASFDSFRHGPFFFRAMT